MESIYIKLALYSSTIECARTDNVFFPISEVCDDMVSLADLLPLLGFCHSRKKKLTIIFFFGQNLFLAALSSSRSVVVRISLISFLRDRPH